MEVENCPLDDLFFEALQIIGFQGLPLPCLFQRGWAMLGWQARCSFQLPNTSRSWLRNTISRPQERLKNAHVKPKKKQTEGRPEKISQSDYQVT